MNFGRMIRLLPSSWDEPWQKSGNLPGARDALESSLKLSPSQMTARLLLGRVYLELKDAKNADDQFEAALLVDSNNIEGRMGLAEAQIQQSNFASAITDLEALVSLTRKMPLLFACSRAPIAD